MSTTTLELTTLAPDTTRPERAPENAADVAWLGFGAIITFALLIGFGMREAGLTRPHSTETVLRKNVSVFIHVVIVNDV